MTVERFAMPRKRLLRCALMTENRGLRNDGKDKVSQWQKKETRAMTGKGLARDARDGKARANECAKFANKQETER